MKRKRPRSPSEPAPSRESFRGFPIVGIGASAGGLEAATDLLRALSPSTGMAFVIVTHLDPSHPSMLVTLLQKLTEMPVTEVKHGTRVEPNSIYVIPPNTAMVIEDRRLKLSPRGTGKQMAIDQFLTSLAADLTTRAIGILLSGTASDGVIGMEAIKAEGGITFAQDEKSAKYPEMPKNAVTAGCVDLVLPPAEIARELHRVGRHPYVAEPAGPPEAGPLPETSKSFPRVFDLIRKATQVDFTHYKRATIQRRIARRMALHRMEALDDYVQMLQRDPNELAALYQDLLIKVTGFFRDPGAFALLKSKIFPALVKNRPRNAPLRIWTTGCSTGQEAYSIAIAFVEYLSSIHATIPCQIFATDLSDDSIERARSGTYLEHIAADLSPERLRRFFVKVAGGYQIVKMIRDMCVIAKQDLIKDPPFSKIDLISCRNVLIYLEPVLHRKVFPMFHYALRPGGYLMLGTSETVGTFTNLFQLADRKYRIYSRKSVAVPIHFDLPTPDLVALESAPEPPEPRTHLPPPPRESNIQREVDRLLLNKFTPSGVVVDEDAEILQFRGQTDRYLQPAPGKASLNLLKMAREGLLFELRGTFQRARKKGTAARSEPVRLAHPNGTWNVRIEVIPLSSADPHARQYLVLFGEDATEAGAKSPSKRGETDRQVDQLRQELSATKEHLQSIIEEQETTNEELKSANEEILSSNEELQSTNEELETAKEELQSTNEELTTLNEELQNRNLELTQVNNDIINLLASVNLPIIMLGNDLRIRRFTPLAEKVLNLIPTDVGRPITDIKSNLEIPTLEKMILEAIESVATQELEVRDRQGGWWRLRIRPYRTRENKIDGAVMIFLDIDGHKRMTKGLSDSRDYAELLFDSVRDAILILDADLKVRRVNPAFYSMFRMSQEETEGRSFFDLRGGEWNLPELREKLERILPDKGSFQNHAVELDLPRLGPPARRKYLLSARRTADGDGTASTVLLTVSEVNGR